MGTNGKQPVPIVIVQGGQWGSEAKGAIAAHLCTSRDIRYAVRTGAINAGHTVVYKGHRYAMQQLPTGWVNPHTNLVIGAGAYIHPETLQREIEMVNDAMPDLDVRDRLIIDSRCGTHLPEHQQLSSEANRHHRMGATGKGCSEAVVAKIRNRNAGYQLFAEWLDAQGERGPALLGNLAFMDTETMLNHAYDAGKSILIEGTQGTFLDLHLGPYPFTTNRMTSAANWVAECGLAPGLKYETVLVVRTFPIRVAGNSGPMPNEIEWSDLAIEINDKLRQAGRNTMISQTALDEWGEARYHVARNDKYDFPSNNVGSPYIRLSDWTPQWRDKYRVAASELHRDALLACSDDTQRELKQLFEMTTVTKKLRRLARIDGRMLKRAVAINRPSSIAVTFMDYQEPVLAGMTRNWLDDFVVGRISDQAVSAALTRAARYLFGLEKSLGVPISLVTTGPNPEHVIDARDIMMQQRSER